MKMIYMKNKKEIQYSLKTDPAEAQYWTTYRLKKSDIKLETKTDRSTAALLRKEILDDITSTEKCNSKPPNKVSKKRSGTVIRNHAKTRKTK
tara:strand:- start:242 stop:517 length:276 start_codon:yes stop_codon:yes gene_type:complete